LESSVWAVAASMGGRVVGVEVEVEAFRVWDGSAVGVSVATRADEVARW